MHESFLKDRMRYYIDLGSYVGDTLKKAIDMFSPNIDLYIGFEPVPLFFKKLKQRFIHNNKVKIYRKAVDIETGIQKLYLGYNFPKRKGGITKGSTLISGKRTANISKKIYIEVKTIDFSKYVLDNFNKDDYIVLKIDIEGKEYDVLEKMIEDGSINYIDKIYCEWHFYKIKTVTERRHNNIISKLNSLDFNILGTAHGDEFSRIE